MKNELVWIMNNRHAVLGVIILIFAVTACGTSPNLPLTSGTAVPLFSGKTAHGEDIQLAEFEGGYLLIAFISIDMESFADYEVDPSRAQLAILKSMINQFGVTTNGRTALLLVDGTGMTAGRTPSLKELINFTYDWNLPATPIIAGRDANRLINEYSITQIPTTLLISPEGILLSRWDGLADAPTLAFALQDALDVSSSGHEKSDSQD